MADLARRARLGEKDLRTLSEAGALTSIGTTRREGMWAAGPLGHEETVAHGWIQPTIPGTEVGTVAPTLPNMTRAETIVADVLTTGISSDYPTVLIRDRLTAQGIRTIADITTAPIGTRLRVGGIVTHRQRPHTARGTIFSQSKTKRASSTSSALPGSGTVTERSHGDREPSLSAAWWNVRTVPSTLLLTDLRTFRWHFQFAQEISVNLFAQRVLCGADLH